MATLLYRLGALSFRRRAIVLTTWLVLVGAIIGCYAAFGGKFNNDFTIPGSESQQALDVLRKTVPSAAGSSAQIVFVVPVGQKVTDPRYLTAIKATVAEAATAPQVAMVVDPVTAQSISRDGRTALASVQYKVSRFGLRKDALKKLERSAGPARAAGMRVEFGGNAYGTTGAPVSGKESIGVVVAMLVLILTFGSLLTAGMPLLTALIGVLMLGLAVGIDYALFILSRHRSQLSAGMSVEKSIALATATAGSAVVFAGLTVIIALAGLAVVRLPFLTVMGLGAAGTVAVAVAVAITLLPALLGFAGTRLTPKEGSRAERRERSDAEGSQTGGERWARLVTRQPIVTVVAVIAVLFIVAIPAPQLRLALPDNGSAPSDSTQRHAYDLISSAFGPGSNGPLLIVVTGSGETSHVPGGGSIVEQAAGWVAKDMFTIPGVLAVTQPQVSADHATAVIPLIPKTAPDAVATKNLVKAIRKEAPKLESATHTQIAVTGATAIGIDVSDRLSNALAPFACVVVGLALLLLLVVFRSIVVPIKATVGFLLTIAASFGAVVAVFQWGWLAAVIRVDTTGPVISFLPIIVMGVLFGLAMDYEVFVVSRIREDYVHTGQARPSVVTGTRHAARVVTAAALIMFAVFASFIGSQDTVIKAIAFALAFGVFVDAFLIRMTLVPAVLALVRGGAWWLPRWLDRALPNLDIEGQRVPR